MLTDFMLLKTWGMKSNLEEYTVEYGYSEIFVSWYYSWILLILVGQSLSDALFILFSASFVKFLGNSGTIFYTFYFFVSRVFKGWYNTHVWGSAVYTKNYYLYVTDSPFTLNESLLMFSK